MTKMRLEADSLGQMEIPADAYWGINTARAVENFPISSRPVSVYADLVVAFAQIKQASARANGEIGVLDTEIAGWIDQACQEIIDGQLHDQFVVGVIQGGAGTSTNMNANEVIANRALELAGRHKGDYAFISPNDHVNRSQSTNDTYPSALKLSLLHALELLGTELALLRQSFRAKSREFRNILKVGRTQLQDAVPMTLGQEFRGFATTLGEDVDRIRDMSPFLRELNLGATAIGTGIAAPPGYSDVVIRHLRVIADDPELYIARDLIEATSDTGVFMSMSSVMKRAAMKLSKICNDLRLLSSGPQNGLGEIQLPPRQAGSSIMPGKVNPVIPEAVNQVAFSVAGADLTVTMACEAGQLQLNAFEPVIAHSLMQSAVWLRRACRTLRINCIDGIRANEERLRLQVESSVGVVTALTPYIGYVESARVAKEALAGQGSVADLVTERGLMSREKVAEVLEPSELSGSALDTTANLEALTPEKIAEIEARLDRADRDTKA